MPGGVINCRRLGSLSCACSMCDVNCSSAITPEFPLFVVFGVVIIYYFVAGIRYSDDPDIVTLTITGNGFVSDFDNQIPNQTLRLYD